MNPLEVIQNPQGLYLVVERSGDTMRILFTKLALHDAATAASVYLRRN